MVADTNIIRLFVRGRHVSFQRSRYRVNPKISILHIGNVFLLFFSSPFSSYYSLLPHTHTHTLSLSLYNVYLFQISSILNRIRGLWFSRGRTILSRETCCIRVQGKEGGPENWEQEQDYLGENYKYTWSMWNSKSTI